MEAGSAVPTRSYTYDGATPQSLAAFLLRECREHFCAYGHCKRALSKGRVKVDGVVAHAGAVVTAGQVVSFEPTHEVRLMQDAAGSTHRRIVYYERVPVVAETDHWAVVLKPPGLVMDSAASTSHEGAKASLRTLAAILPFSLRPTSAAGALLIPAAVHRLDAPVGGLVACAKTRPAARRLQALFSERRVRKSYVAVLAGTPPYSISARSRLDLGAFPLGTPPRESGVVRSPLEGKECVTFYRLLASQPSAQFGSLSTVELRPHTGSTHSSAAY